MLPRPATTAWSSSAALIGVRLPASAADSAAGVKASDSGSGPRPASSGCASSSAVGTRSIAPKRRGSTKPMRVPSSSTITTCSCCAPELPRMSENLPLWPCARRQRDTPGCATSRPDMPRWISRLSPPDSRIRMYLPRRRKPRMRRPREAFGEARSGSGQRRSGRRASARRMVRPSGETPQGLASPSRLPAVRACQNRRRASGSRVASQGSAHHGGEREAGRSRTGSGRARCRGRSSPAGRWTAGRRSPGRRAA